MPVRTKIQNPAAVPAAPVACIAVMNHQDILSLEQLAERLLVKPRVVYGLTRTRSVNPIPFFRVGKALRFYWPAVCAWSQNQPQREYRPRKRKPAKKAA
jgi:hypothetical protein